MDPLAIPDEMYELGLVPQCAGWVGRDTRRRRCGIETPSAGVFCTAHGGDQLNSQRMVVKMRQRMQEEILPKAAARVMAILESDGAKDADIIKIWATLMDRVGLGVVQGLVVEGDIRVDAPLEILRRMLTANQTGPEALMIGSSEIWDAEVVEEE